LHRGNRLQLKCTVFDLTLKKIIIIPTLYIIQTSHAEYLTLFRFNIPIKAYKYIYIYICILWKYIQILINLYPKASQKTLKYVFWDLFPRYGRSIKKVYIIITKGLLWWQPFCVIYYSRFHSNTPMSMGYQYIADKDYNI